MDHSEEQKKNFKDSLLGNGNGLFQFRTRLIRGTSMEGMVVGGNIRCLLKLAGTPFWPDMQDKILFLESRGGGGSSDGHVFKPVKTDWSL